MSERETMETQSFDIIEGLIRGWVDVKCRIADAGAPNNSARQAIREMQALHLAEPWLITSKIFDALKLSGWTPPEGHILIDYSKQEEG